MTSHPHLTPATDFPWQSLPRVPRGLARVGARLNIWLRHAFDTARLQRALGDILAGEVSWQLSSASSGAAPPMAGPFLFHADRGLVFEVWAEPALIDLAVRRVFGKPTDPVVAGATLAPALRGAFAAIVVEAFRRSSPNSDLVYVTHEELHGSSDGTSELNGKEAASPASAARNDGPRAASTARENEVPGFQGASPSAGTPMQGEAPPFFQLRLRIDQRPFSLLVRAAPTRHSPASRYGSGEDRAALLAMGPLPLRLSLVAAECALSRKQLEELVPGDAIMPGTWFLAPSKERMAPGTRGSEAAWLFEGRGYLSRQGSQKGIEVLMGKQGSLQLGSEVLALPWELGERGVEMDPDAASHGKDEASVNELHRQTLEVPLVVRVEIAEVSLTAREWAELGPGDVVETGVKLGSHVTLRVAGVPVAKGELVNVEGELGVRIVELNPDD